MEKPDLSRLRELERINIRKRRLRVLSHYSGGVPHCECCGEKEIQFLTLDHKNNDGALYRNSKGKRISGTEMYRWAVKNNYPDTFQVLCYNCNCSKGFYGICPHKSRINR